MLTAAATMLSTRKIGPNRMRPATATAIKNVACRVEAIGPRRVLTFGRAALSGAEEPVAVAARGREGFRTTGAAGGLSCVALAER